MYKLRFNLMLPCFNYWTDYQTFKTPTELISFYEENESTEEKQDLAYAVILPDGTGMPITQFIHEFTANGTN